MSEVFSATNLVALGCVLGLVLVLGGGIAVMLYGVRGLAAMGRQWLDRK